MHDDEEVYQTNVLSDAMELVAHVEFRGLGANPRTSYRNFQTPRFWTFGTCRIAILMNGYPRAVSSVSTWPIIAHAVDRIQRCPKHAGYMFKGDAAPGAPNETPIGIHVYAVDSEFAQMVTDTITTWVENAKGGAQQDPTPLPDASNVGDEDPDISDTDTDSDMNQPGPSKRPRAGPSTYCLPNYDCGDGAICGPVKPRTNSGVMFGKIFTALETIGQCISDPFGSTVARRRHKRNYYDRIGQARAPAVCNTAIYGRPKKADCERAAAAMETDPPVTNDQRWLLQTAYGNSGMVRQRVQAQDPLVLEMVRIPRTYQSGTCIIGINIGHNPLPDDGYDIASKIAVGAAAVSLVASCPGYAGSTSRLNAGGLIVAGRQQKLWITAFHVPNLPNLLARRRSRGYANDPQVNAYLRTCDWPGGGNVKRTGIPCVQPNGIDDDLDKEEPDMSDEEFKNLINGDFHEMAASYGAQYCTNDEFCGVGFGCQIIGTAGFGLLMGIIMDPGGRLGFCERKP
ncbi:MAG: hypothetical protein M1812_001588 [Candelaria pacifica]|nr:MAG: hypothetical protein M1812_001588 [Candelaria pacifica]